MFTDIKNKMDELREQGKHIYQIFIHPTLILPGWMFLVEFENEIYLILNARDLERALEGLPLTKAVDVEPRIFDAPISIKEAHIRRIMKGVFIWAKQVKGG